MLWCVWQIGNLANWQIGEFMNLFEQQQRQYVRQQAKALTPLGKQMLVLFLRNPGQEFDRRQLAYALGKGYLMRHDLKLLRRLVELRFVIEQRRWFRDEVGAPSTWRGNNIQFAGFYLTYTVNDVIRPHLPLRK